MSCAEYRALDDQHLKPSGLIVVVERLNVHFANISLFTFANFDDSWLSKSSTTAASSADCGAEVASDDWWCESERYKM